MLPVDKVIDYSVEGTPSEQVSLLQLNLHGALPEPHQDDIPVHDRQKLSALVLQN